MQLNKLSFVLTWVDRQDDFHTMRLQYYDLLRDHCQLSAAKAIFNSEFGRKHSRASISMQRHRVAEAKIIKILKVQLIIYKYHLHKFPICSSATL